MGVPAVAEVDVVGGRVCCSCCSPAASHMQWKAAPGAAEAPPFSLAQVKGLAVLAASYPRLALQAPNEQQSLAPASTTQPCGTHQRILYVDVLRERACEGLGQLIGH